MSKDKVDTQLHVSVAQRLWPELMEFAEKSGVVHSVDIYLSNVKESGFLRFCPMAINFTNRSPKRVPSSFKLYRKVSLDNSQELDD